MPDWGEVGRGEAVKAGRPNVLLTGAGVACLGWLLWHEHASLPK